AYVIEEDKWISLDKWPIKPSKEVKMYLSNKKGKSNDKAFALKSRKGLIRKIIRYIYDPKNPVIATGGETIFTSQARRGSNPMPAIGERDDVVSFVTEPLEEDMTIAGAIKVVLNLSTDVDDSAFAFTLSEITPDGETYNMRTSITTLGYRNNLLGERQTYRPGKRVQVEIISLPIVWTVKKGNAYRLDIKSSNFPEYAIHSNYAGVWANQPDSRIAHQTIYVGGLKGSYISIPTL
ncbi:MAG: CocE/NonD family hydrolase, partial [Bacteroidales bacterium]|nr:CocE/NonD family hydrolase [Bacteroidales bacterium]